MYHHFSDLPTDNCRVLLGVWGGVLYFKWLCIQSKNNDVWTMAHKNWCSHNLLPPLRLQGTTAIWQKMARNICGMCTVHMLAYTNGLQVSRLFIVLHVFSVYTDDYFQFCKIPDLKTTWSQAPWVHDVQYRKSIPFFQDVVSKYPIYKIYQPLVGFLSPSSLTVHF